MVLARAPRSPGSRLFTVSSRARTTISSGISIMMLVLLSPCGMALPATRSAMGEGAPHLRWLGSASREDLGRFPDGSNPGWLEVSLPSACPVIGGAIGLVVWGPEGVAAAQVLCDGRRPPHRPESWTIDPPEDGRGGPPGYVRFALESPRKETVAIDLRLAVQGPERPLRIELCWWALDSPAGSDTVEAEGDPPGELERSSLLAAVPFVTVLGGPPLIKRGPVLHAISPRTVSPGDRIRLLGADLDRIGSFAVIDGDRRERRLARDTSGAYRRYFVPLAVTGPLSLLLDGARAAFGTIQVLDAPIGAPGRNGPLWTPPDGDVLVIAADCLFDGLAPLGDDLLSRGFRPSSTSLGRISSEYGTVAPAEAIRRAVSEACSDFRTHPLALVLVGTASEDDPSKDLLPTVHVEYEHEFPGYYDSTYAEDAAFGDLAESPDLESELLVGRIPVRTPAELASYVTKLQAYREQPPQPRLLLAVGDAAINHDNSDRARAAGSLMQTLQAGGVLSASAQYASSYVPLSDAGNRQRALSDFQGRLADGVGILDLFGNNTRATNIVHMFESPPGPQLPWLSAEAMPTAGRLPIALFNTCLNGAFDEDGLFAETDSPAETWLRDPTRGAIACIAQAHITTFFDDWEFAEWIFRRLARRDGVLLGALHAGARWDLLSQRTRGERSLHSVRMANLLGDPLLEARLGIAQMRLEGSFEASGSWPEQNRLCFDRGWTTTDFDTSCASARVVYGGIQSPACGAGASETAYPIGGSRMLRVGGSHRAGVGRRAAAWRIFRCDLLVERGSILTYWVRQEKDPRGIGRLCVDAVTESGRILSRELLDSSGHPADPELYHYTLGAWHRITVRLDPWQGEKITSLYARYDDPLRPGEGDSQMEEGIPRQPGDGRRQPPLNEPYLPGGAFAGYLDEVRVDIGFTAPIVDGDFSVDDDGDRHPDHWFASGITAISPRPTRATAIRDEGRPELWCDPAAGTDTGASQLLGPFLDPAATQFLRFEARSNEGAVVEVALLDPATRGRIERVTVGPLSASWREWEVLFTQCTRTPALLSLTALGGTAGVRALRFESAQTSQLAEGSGEAKEPGRVRIGPNPSRGELRVAWDTRQGRPSRIELLDISGRRIVTWYPRPLDQGLCESFWPLRDVRGRPLPTGAYFLRIEGESGTETRTVQLVR
jgi:hypothetical protein